MSTNCRIIEGNVFDLLPQVPAGSIDCAVTSPPYWMLRAYLPKGHPLKPLELGQEPTPQEYVANCVRWCRLVRDCLADHGTLWLNVGDTYSGSGRGGGGSLNDSDLGTKVTRENSMREGAPGIEAGNLCLIPQRLAIALQDDGWLVRSVVVWRKPSPMPDSIKGWMWRRCRVKVKAQATRTDNKKAAAHSPRTATFKERHEKGIGVAEWADCPGCKKCEKSGGYVLRRGSWRPTSSWEPVLMLAKSVNYYADGEPTKTPPAAATVSRDKYSRITGDAEEQYAVEHDHETVCDTGAKLRDVWAENLEKLTREQLVDLIESSYDRGDVFTIPFEPLKAAHYAAYPSELVHKCLASSVSEEGYCDRCGKPFVRVVAQKSAVITRSDWGERAGNRTAPSGTQVAPSETKTLGWRASCRCPDAKPRPGRVLDPFCGSGRTAIAARRLGLDFVGIELNPEFAAMARRLVTADAPLFNVVADDFGGAGAAGEAA